MGDLKIVSGKTCSLCGKSNKELIQIDSEITGTDLSGVTKFVAKVFNFKKVKSSYICQSCVSKGFRSFTKGK